MRTLFCAIALSICLGCQTTAPYQADPYQTGGYVPNEFGAVPMQQQPAMGGRQYGSRAMNVVGDLAGGFVRSVAGGAGFSAGRDLWNSIAN